MMSQHFNTVLEHIKSVSLRKGRSTPEPEDTNNSLADSEAATAATKSSTTTASAPPTKSSCNFFKFQSTLLPSLTSSIIPSSSTTSTKSIDVVDESCPRTIELLSIQEDEFVVNGSGSGSGSNKSNRIPDQYKSTSSPKPVRNNSNMNSSNSSNCNPTICSKCSNKIDTFDTQIIRKRASICVPNGDYRIRNNNISPMGTPIATKSRATELTTVGSPSISSIHSPKKANAEQRSRTGSLINTDEEGRPILVRKPIKVKNVSTGAETYDSLHLKGRDVSNYF